MENWENTRYLALKVAMMPRDTNPLGTVFGGVILSTIDQAGHVGACHYARVNEWPDHRLVTVAMDGVEFHEPVFVGDVVSFWTRVLRVGRTSITMHVSVETERGDHVVNLTEARVTYVAVERSGDCCVPMPIRDDQRP